MVQKVEDKYSALLEYKNEKELTDVPDTIEALLTEARNRQYDMATLLRRMKSMVHFIDLLFKPESFCGSVHQSCTFGDIFSSVHVG